MRKLFFPIIASLVFLLSSCLGDNDNSFSGTNLFGVVTTMKSTTGSGSKYLATQSYLLTFDDINKYSDGDAVYLSYYKGKTSNTNSAGVTSTNDITIANSYPNSVQKQLIEQSVDTTANVIAGIGLRSISAAVIDERGTLSNRNLMDYSVNKKEGEVYNINFYYDADKQVDRSGRPLSSNRAVIDVVLTRTGVGVGNEVASSTRFVFNATGIRQKLQPSLGDFGTNQIVSRYVDFRYSMYDTTTGTYKQNYTSNMFTLYYIQSK